MARPKRGKTIPPGIAPPGPAEGAAAGEDTVPAEFEKYLGHIAHLDIPLAARIELIRAVRAIMQSFVDRAFGEDPTQLALAAAHEESDAEFDSDMIGLSSDNRDNQTMPTDPVPRRAKGPDEKAIH